MPTSRDDDLEWLYGRDRPTAEPERTRVMDRTALEPPQPPPSYPGRPPGPPPPPPSAQAQRPPRPRRRHPVRTVFLVVVVLLVLALLWLIGVPAYAWSKVARLDADPGGDRPANQPGQTFLLVGSDSREGLTKEEQKRLGTGSTAGRRTDTIMIVYVPAGR